MHHFLISFLLVLLSTVLNLFILTYKQFLQSTMHHVRCSLEEIECLKAKVDKGLLS